MLSTTARPTKTLPPPEAHYRPVKEEEMGEFPNVTVRFLPRPCMQCESSPCTKVCPVKTTYYRPDGIIAMDYEKCIGCKYCIYFLGLCYHFLASSAPPGPVYDADLVGMGGFLGKRVCHEERFQAGLGCSLNPLERLAVF